MAASAVSVALPSTTITIISLAQAAASSAANLSFPHLKIKVTPFVDIPLSLAPQNARGKGLEENIKVVTPIGGKVTVGWHVDSKALPVPEEDLDVLNPKIQIAVREWLVLNLDNLGIDRFDDVPTSGNSRSELVLTPTAALPSRSPLSRPIIPSGEPVANVTRIDIALRWHYPAARGRKRQAVSEADAEQLLSFEAIFADPQAPPPERESQPSPEPEESQEPEDIDPEAEVLGQVGFGMQKVMRLQMIRRFPYVFDGQFIEYQDAVLMPLALFDGVNRFITLSSRFGTPLVGQCRELFEDMQQSRWKSLAAQANAMARLPAYARPQKRIKADSQSTDSQPSQAESQKPLDEDARLEKITSYLQGLRLADEDKSMEDKLYDTLAEGVAAIGTARWLQARQDGRTRMSAYRAFLREPQDFPAFLPGLQDVTDDLAWDAQVPTFPGSSFCPPLTPDHRAPNAPFETYRNLSQPEDHDDFDDLDAEDCYYDDNDEGPDTPHLSVSDGFSSPMRQTPVVHNPFNNALQLELGIPRGHAWPTQSFSHHTSQPYPPQPTYEQVVFRQPQCFPVYKYPDQDQGNAEDWRAGPSVARSAPPSANARATPEVWDDLDDDGGEDYDDGFMNTASSQPSTSFEYASYASHSSEVRPQNSFRSQGHPRSSPSNQSYNFGSPDSEPEDDFEAEDDAWASSHESVDPQASPNQLHRAPTGQPLNRPQTPLSAPFNWNRHSGQGSLSEYSAHEPPPLPRDSQEDWEERDDMDDEEEEEVIPAIAMSRPQHWEPARSVVPQCQPRQVPVHRHDYYRQTPGEEEEERDDFDDESDDGFDCAGAVEAEVSEIFSKPIAPLVPDHLKSHPYSPSPPAKAMPVQDSDHVPRRPFRDDMREYRPHPVPDDDFHDDFDDE